MHLVVPNYSLRCLDSLPSYLGQVLPSLKEQEPQYVDTYDFKHVNTINSKWHLFHGLVHLNGIAHILRVNGWAGGSDRLTGKDSTRIWDRLCTALNVQVVSNEDVSNKHGMLLRLLYPVATGHTWYGQFGYTFAQAGFNHTKSEWLQSIQYIRQQPLLEVLEDFRSMSADPQAFATLQSIVQKYAKGGKE